MQRNYNETQLINKFINMIMRNGKKQLAFNIVKQTFFELKLKKKNPFFIFKKAIYNIKPVLYFVLRKRGSRIFKLPNAINEQKATFVALKWLITGAANRLSHSTFNTFSKKLTAELLDASNGIGFSIKKKNELYKVLIENRPYLKFK